jgi:predicted ArsR family transcriptional regulator
MSCSRVNRLTNAAPTDSRATLRAACTPASGARPAGAVRLVDQLELEGELSVGELARSLDITSYHELQQLQVLSAAEVVSRRQSGREGGIYSLIDQRAVRVYELVIEQLPDEHAAIHRRLGAEE